MKILRVSLHNKRHSTAQRYSANKLFGESLARTSACYTLYPFLKANYSAKHSQLVTRLNPVYHQPEGKRSSTRTKAKSLVYETLKTIELSGRKRTRKKQKTEARKNAVGKNAGNFGRNHGSRAGAHPTKALNSLYEAKKHKRVRGN